MLSPFHSYGPQYENVYGFFLGPHPNQAGAIVEDKPQAPAKSVQPTPLDVSQRVNLIKQATELFSKRKAELDAELQEILNDITSHVNVDSDLHVEASRIAIKFAIDCFDSHVRKASYIFEANLNKISTLSPSFQMGPKSLDVPTDGPLSKAVNVQLEAYVLSPKDRLTLGGYLASLRVKNKLAAAQPTEKS